MASTTNRGLVNKQSLSSPEYLTIHAFDGRVVTRISVGTQTDWRHEEECSQDYKYPNQETSKAPHNNLGLLFEQSVSKNMKSELEISPDNEVLDSLSKETPQKPAAFQGETEESLTNLDKITSSSGSDSSEESLQTVLNICCLHCQQLKKPPVTSDQIANSVDPKEFFCCEKAWKISQILLKGAAGISNETVTDRDPAMQKDERLKGLEFESFYHQTPKAGLTLTHTHNLFLLFIHATFTYITAHKLVSATLHNRLTEDALTAMKEVSFPEIESVDIENTFSFNGANARQKRTTPLVKHYNSGQTFIVIFPDGTGQVCYPSGRLAILLSASQSADWCCVLVLEDKHLQPCIQAVFTTRGEATCYHNNGSIWVNLTPWGGTYCSDTGDLKKHWGWLDDKDHVHAPPYQPLGLTMSPNLNIRIQSQEHICITFTSSERSVRLNVGTKLKPNQGKGLMLPGPDMLQRYLQQKTAEINVLLQNIQSLITFQKTVSPQKVKTQQSLISQMERQRLPMKRQQSAKKTP
ncbi:glutamate-rich protein 6-like isoform X2 [Sander lucioperca]|uniref:glutamate-rich protein 6-like isoform X2 n=1 Tax=Sander lucioperca TaxID=283035 RepID=UPI00125E2D04|nr:glutamate-rich protein 6-like isoform X2 [Sander lucioperca]